VRISFETENTLRCINIRIILPISKLVKNSLKRFNKQDNNYPGTSFLISLLLHLVVLVFFAIINLKSSIVRIPEYSIIEFSKAPLITRPKTIKKKKSMPVKEKRIKKTKDLEPLVTVDTLVEKRDTLKIATSKQNEKDQYLEFAKTLLDTFLIRNPQYARMVLKQQASALASKKFNRESLIKRINDELHKYIQEHFPEGSEHELNPYTGPGIQIPIDDLIDKIKDIFN